MTSSLESIAIVGMACRFPGAPNIQAFWNLLHSGHNAVCPVPASRWPEQKQSYYAGLIDQIDGFDAAFFGIGGSEADNMDPQQRLLMMLSWECFEDAGLIPERLANQAVGVFIGLSSADYYQSQLHAADQVDMYTITGAATSVCANRISYFYDLRGPSLIVDTACSSSLSAVHLACESLQRGESSLALAGGVNLLLSPLIQQGFADAMSLSPIGRCQAFADQADGMVRGEGAGLVCLKPLQLALADGDRIYGVIQGSAMGQDGLTNGLTAPSPAGQRAVLQQAYARSQVQPADVFFVEAHGTGTPLGDPIEAKALADVLGKIPQRQKPLRVGSVKSNLGHLEAAAGIAGLIKAALALYHRYLPPTLHAETPNPRIPFEDWGLQINSQGTALPESLTAGVSAFGFGGTNVHIVLQSVLPQEHQTATHAEQEKLLLPLCAKSAQALKQIQSALADYLESKPDTHVADIASHWALRRQSGLSRAVRQGCVVSADAFKASEQLRRLTEAPAAEIPKGKPKVAFLFSGTGSQEIDMGRQLMYSAVFRNRLAEVDQAIQPYIKASLFDLLQQETQDPALGQWMLFGVQLAIAAQWQAWGIHPDAVLGASFAEVSAAVVAGILDLEQGAFLLHHRIEKICTQLGAGRVAVVGLSASDITPYLHNKPVWLATINGPAMCAISGQDDALNQVIQALQAKEIFVRDVRGATAPSHTPMMHVIQADLTQALSELQPKNGFIPFWSTVTMMPILGQELNADYWFQNVSQPVQLYPTLLKMLQESAWAVLEISSHPVSIGSLNGTEGQHALTLLSSLRKDCDHHGPMLQSLGKLYEQGCQIDWQALYTQARPMDLPSYQWELQSYWIKASGSTVQQPLAAYRPQPGQNTETVSSKSFDREQLLAMPHTERHRSLAQHLQLHIARSLHLKADDLPLEQPLKHLGIGSLVGMELYQTLKKQWQVELALSDVLKGPSLNELSDLILQQLLQKSALGTESQTHTRPEILPLSFAQQRFWFFEQLQPDSLSYHIPGVIELKGELDIPRLKSALQALIDRHEILRTIYISDPHGQPYQQILNPCELQFELVNWVDSENELAALAQKPFELDKQPPFRVLLMSKDTGIHRLLIDMHHLVADGYSFKLMLQDLRALYLGLALEPTSQYADFALWQIEQSKSESYQTHLNFWMDQLANAPDYLPLPTDYPRGQQAEALGQRLRFEIPADLQSSLEALARHQGISLYTLLLSAFCVLLHKLSQADDLVIGTPVLGRSESQWQSGVGPYLNMLPIRAQISPQQACDDFWDSLQAVILAGFDHQDLPFEQLVEALNPQRELAWHPIYQYVFALHAPLEAQDWQEIQLNLLDLDLGVARFDMAMTLHPIESADKTKKLGLQGNIEFSTALFRPETIQAMASAYLCILEQWQTLFLNQTQGLAVLSAEEETNMLQRVPFYLHGNVPPQVYNALNQRGFCLRDGIPTQAPDVSVPIQSLCLSQESLSPRLKGSPLESQDWHNLSQRILDHCEAYSTQIALQQELVSDQPESEFKSLSYGQLKHHAQALAIELNKQSGERIAVILPRSIEMVIAWIGALWSGVTFIPLDPEQPMARLLQLIDDSQADIIVTDLQLPESLSDSAVILSGNDIMRLSLDESDFKFSNNPTMYQIYTSGSTGQPKGVCVSQSNLNSLIAWHHQRYPLPVGSAVTQVANPAFDAAIWEVWTILSAGLCLHLPAKETLHDPIRLRQYWHDHQIQLSFVPTPLWERVQQASGPEIKLRYVLTGGDRLQSYPPADASYELHNHYGPTENTVVTTACRVWPVSHPTSAPSIGLPLPRHKAYILDAWGHMLPSGLAGELWIEGPGVAQGYWKIDPEQPGTVGTPWIDESAFVQIQKNNVIKTFYRTGDRVRLDSDPEKGFHFLGRSDQQIKVRGVRIEPQEIEQTLLHSPFAIQACEVVFVPESQQLAAFVCSHDSELEVGDLRQYLAERLPAVMLPQSVNILEQMPLTARGKVNHRVLQTLALEALQSASIESKAIAGSLPETLAAIWQNLLPGVAVQPESDFFALGGHSLMALDLRHQIQQHLGLDLPLSQLFKHRNLNQLAQYLQSEAPLAPWPELKIMGDQHFDPFELNDMQQAYWIGRQSSDGKAVSAHAYLEMDFQHLNIKHLQAALRQLIHAHPMLRCVIDANGQQQVLEQVPEFTIVCEDLTQATDVQTQSYLNQVRQQLSHEVRPADQWPLFGIQATLLPTVTRLHLSIDALICDATSLMLLAQQLQDLYQDPDLQLEPSELHFRDALIYEKELRISGLYARHRQYWQDRIADLPLAPQLPLKKQTVSATELRFGRQSAKLNAKDWSRLKDAASQLGVTPSCLLLSVFGQVLSAWQDHQSLTLNLTTFARLPVHDQINQIVGDFTRLSLLAFEVNPDHFVQQTRDLQARLLADLDHGLYHGIQVMRDLRQQRGVEAARMPVVFTSMLGHEDQQMPFESMGGKLAYSQTQTPQVWLDHQVSEPGGVLCYDWDYPLDLFPDGLIESVFSVYQQALNYLLQSLPADFKSDSASQIWSDGLPAQIWQATDSKEPDISLPPLQHLHAALMAQIQKTPTAIAIIDAELNLSYAQLWHLALKAAKSIAPHVTQTDTPIAICLTSGWRQAVAVLAVLMAGGTYLPLNPAWPSSRLQSLLQRCQSPVLICQPEQAAQLEYEGTILTLDLPDQHDLEQLSKQSINSEVLNSFYKAQPDDLAYIIFTSGSTGEPKGVMIEHQAAWNTVEDINQRLTLKPDDRVLALSDLNFDLSVWDLFGPLSVGAAIVYPDASLNREPAHWLDLCQQHRISIWNSVPALMGMLTAYANGQPERRLPDLRAVLLSGDWIPLTLPDDIRSQLTSHTRVISMGGATEASIWSIWYEIEQVDPSWNSIPYGKGLHHQDIVVLDSRLDPCPVWAAGDLYITGYGLARGYFGDPEQSAYRFITHPVTGKAMYRTGDRGRRRSDGNLEFLGRQDLQVKIQGYRIELTEIESALQSHPQIDQAMVLAISTNPDSPQAARFLVGCLQAQEGLSEQSLEQWLGLRLPSYMIPVRWLWLQEDWPLNATGKVDRKALQQWAEKQLQSSRLQGALSLGSTEPLDKLAKARGEESTAVEASALIQWQNALSELLRQSLNLPELLPEQDFLSLGVNSIDLVRVGNLLEQRYGVTPGMGEMFSLRNLRALAQWYADHQGQIVTQTSTTQAMAITQRAGSKGEPGSLIALPLSQQNLPDINYTSWHSQREFGTEAISLTDFAALLSVLSQTQLDSQPKWLYPSAGGVYAVNTYLQLRPQAVTGLDAGFYRYDSVPHSLELIQTGDRWPDDLHLPVAQTMAAASRFSLYLVLDLAAMQAKYGPDARDYGLIEAGAMSQLLRQQAGSLNLGLCAIGQVNPQHVKDFFSLSPEQILLHSLIGGPMPVDEEYEEWVI